LSELRRSFSGAVVAIKTIRSCDGCSRLSPMQKAEKLEKKAATAMGKNKKMENV
jgi:hypothetical protein